jgi:peptidoglycan hydrolase-like protein with peptidoglycan-binding domain
MSVSSIGASRIDGPEPAPSADPPAAIPAAPTAAGLASALLRGDATLEAIARGERTLAVGARGDAVKKVQQGLIAAGIAVRGGADGIYGQGTASSVATFQRQKGLPATGTIDAATLFALDRALAAPSSTPAVNARFAGDSTLERVLRGATELGPGARGAHVTAIQQALIDIGYNMPVYGADGGYGKETVAAVKRFQRDFGLPMTGRVDRRTLEALGRVAPPPGKTLERNPEYDKLFEDGRLDITIAQGFDEGGSVENSVYRIQRGLFDQGFTRIRPETMSEADRARLGLGPDRFEAGATYFTKRILDPVSRKPVDVVVKLITPSSAATPEEVRDMFRRALERDEVVAYNGHARYGTGPDFDVIDSGRGNFVIDRDGGPSGHPHAPLTDALRDKPETMLSELRPFPGKYQLLYFNACTTENYMENLRDPQKFLGRNTANTDILGSTIPTRIATGADHVLGFVSMLSGRRSVNEWTAAENARESAYIQSLLDQGYSAADLDGVDAARARGTFFESGFADNASNRVP